MHMRAKPKGSEISRYDTLKQVEKSIGRTPADLLNGPILKDEHARAWELFNTLPAHSYQELDAYVRLTGEPLEPWETEAIIKLSRHIGEDLSTWPPK